MAGVDPNVDWLNLSDGEVEWSPESQHQQIDGENNTAPTLEQAHDSMSGCSTPNEGNACEPVVGSPAKSPKKRRERPTQKSTDDDDSSEVTDRLNQVVERLTGMLHEEMDSPKEEVALSQEEAPKIDRFLFNTVPEAEVKEGCQNKREKEGVRNHDRAPHAAIKRFCTPQDKLDNTAHNQMLKIKFDRTRTEKFASSFHNSDEQKIPRRRCYSDPIDAAAFGHEDLLIDSEQLAVDEVIDEATIREKEMFARLTEYLEKEYAVICPKEDSGRIEVPDNYSVILARVMNVEGRRATVVPAAIFEHVSKIAREFVTNWRPSPLPPDFNSEACVLVEQESDVIDQYDYLRGWLFASNDFGVFVMLMDEMKIVNVLRTRLCICPDEIVKCAPPLAVTAELDREMTKNELSLLVTVGCTAQFRVMEEKEEDKPLKLHLVKVDTTGRTLDTSYFCSEECAGACAYGTCLQ